MKQENGFSREQLRYLQMLSHQYPSIEAASTEIIKPI